MKLKHHVCMQRSENVGEYVAKDDSWNLGCSVEATKKTGKLFQDFTVYRYGKQVNYFSISVFYCLFSTELQRISYTRSDL